MYEQVSHSLLNEILDRLKPEIRRSDLRVPGELLLKRHTDG
jgi:hypothetical protein